MSAGLDGIDSTPASEDAALVARMQAKREGTRHFLDDLRAPHTTLLNETECHVGTDGRTVCSYPFVDPRRHFVLRQPPSKEHGAFGCNLRPNGQYRCWARVGEYVSPSLAVYDWIASAAIEAIGGLRTDEEYVLCDVDAVLRGSESNDSLVAGVDSGALIVFLVAEAASLAHREAVRRAVGTHRRARCLLIRSRCDPAATEARACIEDAGLGGECVVRNSDLSTRATEFCAAPRAVLLALAFRLGVMRRGGAALSVRPDHIEPVTSAAAWFGRMGWENDPLNFESAATCSLHVQPFLEGVPLCLRAMGVSSDEDSPVRCYAFDERALRSPPPSSALSPPCPVAECPSEDELPATPIAPPPQTSAQLHPVEVQPSPADAPNAELIVAGEADSPAKVEEVRASLESAKMRDEIRGYSLVVGD